MKHVNYSTRAHFLGHWQCSYSLHVAHKSCSPLPGFVFTTIFTTSLKVSRGQCCPDMLSNGDYTGCPPRVSTRKAAAWGELLGKDQVRPHRDPFYKSTSGDLPVSWPWHGWPAAEGHHWAGAVAPLQLTQCCPCPLPPPQATWRSRRRLCIYGDMQPRFRFVSFLFDLITDHNAIKKNLIRSCKRLRNMPFYLRCHDRQGVWDKKRGS